MVACNECLPFPSCTPNDMSHAALTCEGALLDVAAIDADLAGKLYRALPVPLLPASPASDACRGRHHCPLPRYVFPSLVLTRHWLRTLLNASSLASVSASPLSSNFSESVTPPLTLQCSCCVHPTPPVSATAGLHLLGFGVREQAAAVDVVVGVVRAVARGEGVPRDGAAAAALGMFAGDGAQLGGSSRGSSCSAGERAPADDGLIFFSLPVDGRCSTSAAAGDEQDGNASADASADVVTTTAEDRAAPRMQVVHRAAARRLGLHVATALDAAPGLWGLLFPGFCAENILCSMAAQVVRGVVASAGAVVASRSETHDHLMAADSQDPGALRERLDVLQRLMHTLLSSFGVNGDCQDGSCSAAASSTGLASSICLSSIHDALYRELMTCSTVEHMRPVLDTLRSPSERLRLAERYLFDMFAIPVVQHQGANDERSSLWRFEKFSAAKWILALLPRLPVVEFPSTHDIDLLGLMLVTSWASFIESAVLSQAHGEGSGEDIFPVSRASPDVGGLSNPGERMSQQQPSVNSALDTARGVLVKTMYETLATRCAEGGAWSVSPSVGAILKLTCDAVAGMLGS